MLLLLVPVVILGAGVALSLAGARSARSGGPGDTSHQAAHRIPGTSVLAVGSAPYLAHVAANGEPPADVIRAIGVPKASHYLGKSVADASVSQFDRSIRIVAGVEVGVARRFFEKDLSFEHWVLQSISAPSAGTTELIAQRNGSDGYQWRLGITLRGTSGLVTPALGGGAPSTPRTDVTLRLYQVADAS
jgi:hypothetical protein